MRKQWTSTWFSVFPVLLSIGLVGCTYSAMFMDYSKHNMYSSALAGNIQYKEIGPVRAKKMSFVWTPCEDLINDVRDSLVSQAKDRGGNALIDVRWSQGDFYGTEPICQTQWGWIVIWPAMFGPWVKHVNARATIVQIADSDLDKAKKLSQESIKSLFVLGSERNLTTFR